MVEASDTPLFAAGRIALEKYIAICMQYQNTYVHVDASALLDDLIARKIVQEREEEKDPHFATVELAKLLHFEKYANAVEAAALGGGGCGSETEKGTEEETLRSCVRPMLARTARECVDLVRGDYFARMTTLLARAHLGMDTPRDAIAEYIQNRRAEVAREWGRGKRQDRRLCLCGGSLTQLSPTTCCIALRL